MFKLSITFNTITELGAFVSKMGDEVIGATVAHSQELSAEGDAKAAVASAKPPKPPKPPKAKKKEEVVEVPAAPFPGGPAAFAPGNTVAPAAPQPVAPAPVAPVQPAAPVAPAPVAAPTVSPERQQWNDACIALLNQLQNSGIGQQQVIQVIGQSFTEAGCPQGSRVTTITDAQIQAFYPALHKNVSAAIQGAAAQSYT